MALSSLPGPLLILFAILIYSTSSSNSWVRAQIDDHKESLQLMMEALEWPSVHEELSIMEDDEDVDSGSSGIERRSLYWGTTATRHYYYISYGALSANRIPCPARSGRSYYTHNCYRASGPVRPYNRGCSTITRCRR